MPPYQHGGEVRLDCLCFPLGANHSVPYILARWSLVIIGNSEERTVPPGHAVWLFVPVDQVVEDVQCIAILFAIAFKKPLIYLSTSIDGGSYMDLWAYQPNRMSGYSRES